MKRRQNRSCLGDYVRVGALVLLAGFLSSCEKIDLSTEDIPDPEEAVEKAKEVFGKSKETAGKAAEWSEGDLRKIGAWDYKIVRFEDSSDEALEEELNKLGAERWECYWVEETAEGPRFHFKKTKRSYLRHVPIGELMRVFLPDGGQ